VEALVDISVGSVMAGSVGKRVDACMGAYIGTLVSTVVKGPVGKR